MNAATVAGLILFFGGIAIANFAPPIATKTKVMAMAIMVVGVVFTIAGVFIIRRSEHHVSMQDKIDHCIAVGGYPDRYGRYGDQVTCHMEAPR